MNDPMKCQAIRLFEIYLGNRKNLPVCPNYSNPSLPFQPPVFVMSDLDTNDSSRDNIRIVSQLSLLPADPDPPQLSLLPASTLFQPTETALCSASFETIDLGRDRTGSDISRRAGFKVEGALRRVGVNVEEACGHVTCSRQVCHQSVV